MNIINHLKQRILDRAQETSNPCKLYNSEKRAEAATADVAHNVGEIHETQSARYVVFYIEELDRWAGAIDLIECINRPNAVGGYVGYAANAGFYTY